MSSLVHVAIVRQVVGRESEFEKRVRSFFERAARGGDTEGAYLLRPLADKPNEYGILRSFESSEAMERFYSSQLYREWNSEISELVVGEPERRPLHGMEAFFRTEGAQPPAWKMAIVTWLAVNPAVYVFAGGVPAVFGKLPPLLELLVVNGFVVAALTWGLMPALVKLFGGWLSPGGDPG